MLNKRILAGVFILGSFFMPAGGGIAGTNGGPWPMFGHDARHTGQSEYVEKGSADNPYYWRTPMGFPDPSLLETNTSPASPTSSAAVGSDGIIYAGVGHNSDDVPLGVRALYPEPDKPDADRAKWTYATNNAYVQSSPAIGSDGTVYIGSDDYSLYALDPNSFVEDQALKNYKWQYRTSGKVRSSPVIGSDGTIYVGSDDSYLYALSPDGNLKWLYKTDNGVESSPAIGSDGTIYVGSDDSYLYAIDPNGNRKWRYPTGNMVRSSPAIGSDGTIYAGSDDSYLHAITPNGTLKWRYGTGSKVRSSPAISSDGTIYVGSDDGFLYAINPDGTARWSPPYNGGGSIRSSPAISSDGTIILMSGLIYALNPDGTLKWSNMLPSVTVYSSPVIDANGAVYVNANNYLYAFRVTDTGGNIYGIVRNMATDAGAAVKISVLPPQVQNRWETDSGAGGYYLLSRSYPDNWNPDNIFNLTVSGAGYQTVIIPSVALKVGDAIPLDILIPTMGTLAITREALKPAIVGKSYKDRAWVTGGTYPYSFSKSHGTLPPGCTLDAATGSITGTPTAPGSYTFGIKVGDHQSPPVEREREYTIYVMPSGSRGDIDGDGRLSIGDAILGLRALSGMTDLPTLHPEGSNGAKISLQGIIYIIQSLAGMR